MRPRRKHVREQAEELLAECGITKPPVDINRIAKRLGIRIAGADGEDDLASCFVRNTRGGPVIGVNSNYQKNRRRWWTAHQIAHAVLHYADSVRVCRVSTCAHHAARAAAEGDG